MKIDSHLSGLHSEREGEAPQALLGEGAICPRADTHRQTQAPVNRKRRKVCVINV
jgi:hypothetical protein